MNAKQILTTLMMVVALIVVGSTTMAADMPELVSLDTMVEYFDAVEFDHDMHSELGEDCSVCHHHTTGTGTADERCISCHANSDEFETVACID